MTLHVPSEGATAPGRPRRLLRAYGLALGFALGQVGAVPLVAPRPRPAIVRPVDADLAPDGFHPLERLDPATVLTVPWSPGVGAAGPPTRRGRAALN